MAILSHHGSYCHLFVAILLFAAGCGVESPAPTADPLDHAHLKVHVLNPEGVEINSIFMAYHSDVSLEAEVFDGEEHLAYAPDDAYSHGHAWTIAPGIHTIRATFNGREQQKTITLPPGSTGSVTFRFDREEIDFAGFMDSLGPKRSYASVHHISDPHTDQAMTMYGDRNGGYDPNYPETALGLVFISRLELTCPGASPCDYVYGASIDYEMNSREFTITAINTRTQGATHDVDEPWILFWREDVSSVFTNGHPFKQWYVQNVYASVGRYGGEIFLTNAKLPREQNPLFVMVGGNLGYYDYYLTTIPAVAFHYLEFNKSVGPAAIGTLLSVDLSNVRVSSVPYDITGQGIRDEQDDNSITPAAKRVGSSTSADDQGTAASVGTVALCGAGLAKATLITVAGLFCLGCLPRFVRETSLEVRFCSEHSLVRPSLRSRPVAYPS